MPVFKNESNGTWYVMARYVNWKGERKQKCKRGFATKKEAQEWERMFQLQKSSDMDMSFEAFTELYIRDMKSRLKENTWLTKEHIIRTKILPYFGKLKISEISTKEVIAWQNEMLAYRDEKKKPYSQTYLHHEMDRGAKAAGVKRIRIHDLRHSHISLLIDMGFSAVAIADRVGHESIDITYQYAHLFPSKQTEMADRLDDLGKGEIENVS